MNHSQILARVDAAIYEIERRVVGFLLLAMSVIVFLDVMHRMHERVPGRFAVLISELMLRFGMSVAPEAFERNVGALLGLGVSLLVSYFALRPRYVRRLGREKFSLGEKVHLFGNVAALAAVMFLGPGWFARAVPNGIVWATSIALCVLLWVGLLGASMATYSGRHLAMEMGEKIWAQSWQRHVKKISALCTAVFAGFIAVLGLLSVMDHYGAWSVSPLAALIPSADIPKWLVFLVVPYAFSMIGLRSLGRATGLLPAPKALEVGQ